MEILLIALLMLVLMALVVWSYFELGPIVEHHFSVNPDWSDLAVFFGGMLGPLFSLLALLAVVQLMRHQARYFNGIFNESKKLDTVRYLARIDEDIINLLSRDIQLDDGRVAQFGDFIDGLVRAEQQQDRSYKPAMDKLLKLTANYCEAIDTYRELLEGQLTYSIHTQRARELVAYLEQHPEALNPMSRQTVTYCKMHLQGKQTAKIKKKKTKDKARKN